MNTSFKLGPIGLISLALLTACGGGGGGTTAGGSTAANTVSQGTITGFGSVIVDGVRYSSVGAKVQDDEGNTVSRDTLRIGMTVNLTGTSSDGLTSGDAKVIEVRKLLQGPVSNLAGSAGAQTFTVLSQQVQTTASTLVVGTLASTTNVQVFGVLQQDPTNSANDKIIASRIEAVPQTKFEAYGRVSSVATGATSFNIGNLVVTPATGISIPTGLAIGSLVKVSCLSSTTPVCSDGNVALTASKIKLRGAKNDLSNGALVKLHGVIDSVSGNLLSVGGVQIDISNASRGDSNGASSWTPAPGQRIEAKGTYNSSNVLMATRIEQEGYREKSSSTNAGQRYSTELYGIVSAATGTTCTASYVVQSTCVNDMVSSQLPAAGQYVEIKGNMSTADDVLNVVKIEVKNGSQASGGYIEVKGKVAALNTATKTFTLNNTTVNYANATVEGTLANANFAEVKGSQDANGVLQATKVEVEDSAK